LNADRALAAEARRSVTNANMAKMKRDESGTHDRYSIRGADRPLLHLLCCRLGGAAPAAL
jgi:hypothetical protein